MTLPRLAVLFASLGCSALALAAGPTHYPLTVENCGMPLTFKKAPGKTVTIGQAGTEILYSLGMADKVVGTSLWFNDVLPQFKAQNDRIPRLADNEPSFESVIGQRPDLVQPPLLLAAPPRPARVEVICRCHGHSTRFAVVGHLRSWGTGYQSR